MAAGRLSRLPLVTAAVVVLVLGSAFGGLGSAFGGLGSAFGGLGSAFGGLGRAAAQSTPVPITPFPRPIMAFVPRPQVTAASTIAPALAVQSVAVAEGDGIGREANRVVTVGFATPFELPAGTYRAAIVFGDPEGDRTRASFTATDGEAEGGTIETSTDGRRWTSAGATDATLDSEALRVTAPVGTADRDQGLWVEAQIGEDETTRSQSPVFSLDALLGRNEDGALPASTTGAIDVGAVAEPIAIPGSPPTLTVDEHLTVTETDPVPTTVAGQPVTNAIDEITFMPGYAPDGTIPAVVQINRTTGAVSALAGTAGLPADRTGDGSFVVQGPSASTPSTVVLDLAQVAEVLDLPLDPEGLGLGLRRKLTLADGRDVIGPPTMATLVWYETASPTGVPSPTEETATTEPATATTSGSWVMIAGLALVGLVALALVVLAARLVRRRRGASVDRWLDAYTPAEPEDPTAAASMASARVHAASVAGPGPAVTIETPSRTCVESQRLARGSYASSGGDEADVTDHRRSPEDALASFEAEVDAMTERVDRLAHDDR